MNVMKNEEGRTSIEEHRPLFCVGKVVATPGALAAVEESGQDISQFIYKHQCGDWGDMCDEDKQANDKAVSDGLRILSAFRLLSGERIWILTSADRSHSTAMLPTEY